MKKILAALTLSFTALSGVAHAADAPIMAPDNWFVHLGVAYDALNSGMVSTTSPIAAGAHVDDSVTAVFEIGRYVTDNFAIALSGGIPPSNKFSLTEIAALGGATVPAGTATAGPFMLLGQYHFNRGGQIQPYFGAGVAYNITFGTTAAPPVTTSLTVDNALAPVLQVGFDVPVAQHVNLFADVKKVFLTSHAATTGAGGPADTYVRLDPWIISSGIGFTF